MCSRRRRTIDRPGRRVRDDGQSESRPNRRSVLAARGRGATGPPTQGARPGAHRLVEDVPETQYLRVEDVNIAYQVSGTVRRLSSCRAASRTWRAVGARPELDDVSRRDGLVLTVDQIRQAQALACPMRFSGTPTLEKRMDDVRAVMEVVGSRHPDAAFGGGIHEHPLRGNVSGEDGRALDPHRLLARRIWAEEYPWAPTEDRYEAEIERELRISGRGKRATRRCDRTERFMTPALTPSATTSAVAQARRLRRCSA